MDPKLKIVVLGAGGRLGAALVREYASQHEVTGFRHAQLDLARLEVLRPMLEPLSFDVLINAAALTNVDYCEDHRAEAMRLNAEAPRVLAEICREKERRFIHVSTDYVFDGKKRELSNSFAVMQLFNHGTHHRGQLTALIKQAGVDPGVTDTPSRRTSSCS